MGYLWYLKLCLVIIEISVLGVGSIWLYDGVGRIVGILFCGCLFVCWG